MDVPPVNSPPGPQSISPKSVQRLRILRRITVVALIVVSVAPIAAYGLGCLLADEYQGEATVELPFDVDTVWAELNDCLRHPVGGGMVVRVDRLEPANGLPAWIEDMESSRVRVNTIESRAPEWLLRELADDVIPMTARQELRLTRTASGCTLHARHEISIRSGPWQVPLFRLMLTIFDGARRGAEDYCTRIDAVLTRRRDEAAMQPR